MIKKTLFLLLLPLIAELIVSCCNCQDPVIKYFTHKSIAVSHLDNAGSTLVTATSGSVANFDGSHPANADVSAYFKIYKGYAYAFTSIADYLKYPEVRLSNESQFTSTLDLLLMTPPTLNTQHQFSIQITLSDRRVLQTQSSTIDLI